MKTATEKRAELEQLSIVELRRAVFYSENPDIRRAWRTAGPRGVLAASKETLINLTMMGND